MTSTTDIVVPRMAALQRLEKTFKRLNLSWKVIETTARIVSPAEASGFIRTLEHTRASFSQLALEMVDQIALAHLANCQRDLQSRAQVAIDILVRNLFERTADVGFVATDGPLVAFIQTPTGDQAGTLHARLLEYRAKYTVYNDVLLLDAHAKVLLGVQARPIGAHETGAPDWWPRLCTTVSYIEAFGDSAYFPAQGPVLLYAHQVVASSGAVCGAVVLRFDLESEMQSIFAALRDAQQRTVVVVLDASRRVIAASDANRFPNRVQIELPTVVDPAVPVMRHGGVDYLYAHCETRGYQGYGGPGWTALSLVALDQAFEQTDHDATTDIALGGYGLEADNPQLASIVARARDIEIGLNRVIWNGKLSDTGAGSGASMHPVFSEIGRTSNQTLAVFDSAISELRTLLMHGRRTEVATHAALAVNIMDRNLYERANDCRWWALSPELATVLQAMVEHPSAAAQAQAQAVLAHLNSLYTVYRRIVLFDRNGLVLAASRDQQTLPDALKLPTRLVAQTLALQGTQSYAVSAMLPSALCDGAATYLYCAPIRAQGRDDAIGGIALAFNCADELQAMLRDATPSAAHAIGVFLEPGGAVLSTTSEQLVVGQCAPFALATAALDAGSDATLMEWNGQPYLVGLARSAGYREFKVMDGYREDVLGLLLAPIHRNPRTPIHPVLPHSTARAVPGARYYGVVQCGAVFLGLCGDRVIEAIASSAISGATAGSALAGMLLYKTGSANSMLPVYDTGQLLGLAPMEHTRDAVAVVVRARENNIVLLVDRLIDVVACDALGAPPGGFSRDTPWIAGLIHDRLPDSVPVLALDPDGVPGGSPSAAAV